jgi:class 3 adenylate cyclase
MGDVHDELFAQILENHARTVAQVIVHAIQERLARANEGEPEARRMRFRIGINVGDVMVKDGDIFGDGVNAAARLEGLVRGGEICVSRCKRLRLRGDWQQSSQRMSRVIVD